MRLLALDPGLIPRLRMDCVQYLVAAELVFCFLASLASSVEGDTGSAPALGDALALGRAAVWACQGSGTMTFPAQAPHQLLWCQAIPEMLWKVFL